MLILLSRACALLTFVLVFASPIQVWADEEPAWLRASTWARANDGIAIAIRLGSDAGLEPVTVIRHFETGFAEYFGVVAKVFVEQSNRPGSVVAYFYFDHATNVEGFTKGTTGERMQLVVDQYRVARAAR